MCKEHKLSHGLLSLVGQIWYTLFCSSIPLIGNCIGKKYSIILTGGPTWGCCVSPSPLSVPIKMSPGPGPFT